uniref:Protein-export membrane protein SecF n=1 Tax=uncultured beta proteobacterium HF0130_04F21 TaxID=710819 RepID=E0XSS6_9PROT|nr:preprotein translocase subunit secf [uncultured beta proteobacterium HF0130_04F21]
MEFFRIKNDIAFMKHAKLLNCISIFTFIASIVFIIYQGLHFSIEFTGGTLIEVSYPKQAPLEKIRDKLVDLGYTDSQVQNFGTSKDVLIRLPLDSKNKKEAEDVFNEIKLINENEAELRRIEYVGPQIGSELARDGILAMIFVVIGIMIYLAIRFEWKFAVAAIIANLHDVVIILGFFSLFQWEFSLSVLAAVLAVLGYSVNESVVVADRIRENFKRMRKSSVVETINNAITRTMSRTIITHGTTETMVLAMLIFGGPVLHYFAIALTIGIIFGIYSSIFVMAPITIWLGIKREDLVKPVKKDTEIKL